MTDHRCACDHIGVCTNHQSVTDEKAFADCALGIPPTPTNPPPCVYLGKRTASYRRRIPQPIYACYKFGECTLTKNGGRLPACEGCRDYLNTESENLSTDFKDSLRVFDREGNQTHCLRNMLNGGAAFLVCGGPSLRKLDYQRLKERGVFALGINNVAGWAPVSAFICSDPPSKFHSGIFLDPKIMCFLPTPKLRGNRAKLRSKNENGGFDWLDERTCDCPNVWGFERRSWLACNDTWFTEPSAAWGNHQQGVEKTGEPKTVNTMFLGLRILQYLGARIIFLLGVDFFMDPAADLKDNYAFGEHRTGDAVKTNNAQYIVAADWLTRLRPIFEKYGFTIYNCNPNSHLRAFDYVPYDFALQVCKGKIPPEPWDLEGWYVK